jgi:thiol-disulfide isomerase/thioredoxin
MTLPTVEGQSFTGERVVIKPDGHPHVVLFVAHWCPHCQREIPLLSANLRANPLPASVEMVTVSTSVTPAAPNYPPQTWLTRERWPTPVLADDDKRDAGAAFGLSGFPYFVFADAQGKVVARTSGEITVTQFRDMVNRIAG